MNLNLFTDYMYIDLLDESFTDSMDQDSDMSESDTSRSRVSTPELQLPSLPLGVPTLMDSAVKIVAKHVSCAEIENHNPPVDESMLKKVWKNSHKTSISVCETKFCGVIDQSLFYIDLTVHYIQNFENLT